MNQRSWHWRRALAFCVAALGSVAVLVACSSVVAEQPEATLDPTLTAHDYAELTSQQYVYNSAVLRPLPNAPFQIGPTSAAQSPTASAAPQPGNAVAAGQQLFVHKGCIGCHRMEGGGTGPPLQRVYGSQVRLQSGQVVTADEAYIRNSILNPESQVVANYPPVMPSFQGHVTDEELSQLVAYIKSLGSQ